MTVLRNAASEREQQSLLVLLLLLLLQCDNSKLLNAADRHDVKKYSYLPNAPRINENIDKQTDVQTDRQKLSSDMAVRSVEVRLGSPLGFGFGFGFG